MGLTVKRIARANKPGRYSDGHNLYLQVGPTGTKSWLLRYVRDGRERWMGLGSLADFTLERLARVPGSSASSWRMVSTRWTLARPTARRKRWRRRRP